MNKKNLFESDICDKFIRPAMVAAGWTALGALTCNPVVRVDQTLKSIKLFKQMIGYRHIMGGQFAQFLVDSV